MPQRQSTVRVECEEVQGADSYVVLRRMTMAVAREMRGAATQFDRALAILGDQVAGWNWVWEDGSPMPLPSSDPDVMGRLTEQETAFLFREINKASNLSAEELKNSPTRP